MSAAILLVATYVLGGCGYSYPQNPYDYGANTLVGTPTQTPSTDSTQALVRSDDANAAREICAEGSVAECEAACDGGNLATCVNLAQMLHAGTRMPADPDRANRILLRACDRGRSDACLQRGIWMQATNIGEAAELFMRACDGAESGRASTTTSCAMWMNLLDEHVYAPSQDDEIAGLSHICELEESGALSPDSTITNGSLSLRYRGGACGRLKDLGMSGSMTMSERAPAAGDSQPAVTPLPRANASISTNPAAPRW
ncbi:MAG: hypothetical protein ACRELY_04995 [Polyangiaceae bacterium]